MAARGRHVPVRTCVGCRGTAAKGELVRVVRTLDGKVEVDPTGKRAGRGAYLHRDYACWQAALKRDRLAHALRTTLTAQERESLLAHAQTFLEKGEVKT
ncbi:MAG: YlxR family protein [Dehalococcoidia bacterium]|nr:YlxR family protein [Dehalococcoidia bacterium]MDW8009907.1 YlxR family protein [Chloroflexota bacterium]